VLLHRKSLAFIVPSGEQYLILCFSKCVNKVELLSKFSKTCFTTTKETALTPFNLAHPVYECRKRQLSHKPSSNWSLAVYRKIVYICVFMYTMPISGLLISQYLCCRRRYYLRYFWNIMPAIVSMCMSLYR